MVVEEVEEEVVDGGQRLEVVSVASHWEGRWLQVQRGFACEEVLEPDVLVCERGRQQVASDEKKRKRRRRGRRGERGVVR